MKTTLEWLGTATFRLKIGSLVLFLDAYMERVPGAPPVGLRPADFAPLKELVATGNHAEAAAAVTEDMFRLAISGTPDRVVEQIEQVAALGVTQINLGGPLGPDPTETIRLMGELVIPHFRQ